MATNYDDKKDLEVKIIKRKMKKANEARFNITLETIEKAQRILGHDIKENQHIMNEFMESNFEGRRNF